MSAKDDLFDFVSSTVKAIVDEPAKANIECIESGTRTYTFLISCGANDLKFIFSRLKSIKHIAIGIAQKHKAMVNILVND